MIAAHLVGSVQHQAENPAASAKSRGGVGHGSASKVEGDGGFITRMLGAEMQRIK